MMITIADWMAANGNYVILAGGGWSDQNHIGGAMQTLDGSIVYSRKKIDVKVQ
jgi:hypothetical protein